MDFGSHDCNDETILTAGSTFTWMVIVLILWAPCILHQRDMHAHLCGKRNVLMWPLFIYLSFGEESWVVKKCMIRFVDIFIDWCFSYVGIFVFLTVGDLWCRATVNWWAFYMVLWETINKVLLHVKNIFIVCWIFYDILKYLYYYYFNI